MPAPFATVTDLEIRWRPLTSDTERARAEAILDDVSDMIRAEYQRWQTCTPETLRRVTVQVAKRALAAGDVPAGAHGTLASESETTGPFTRQYTYSNPNGDLYLTKADRRALRGGAGAYSIDLLATRDQTSREEAP